MAISPSSLASSASFLQDVKNIQSSKVASQERQAKESAFKIAVDREQADSKSSSVAVEIKTQEAAKTANKVDINIGEQVSNDREQESIAVSIQREAPIASNAQNQRPGSNLDISV